MNGGGFAVINEGSVTFTKPDLVTASGNNVRLFTIRSQRVFFATKHLYNNFLDGIYVGNCFIHKNKIVSSTKNSSGVT